MEQAADGQCHRTEHSHQLPPCLGLCFDGTLSRGARQCKQAGSPKGHESAGGPDGMGYHEAKSMDTAVPFHHWGASLSLTIKIDSQGRTVKRITLLACSLCYTIF